MFVLISIYISLQDLFSRFEEFDGIGLISGILLKAKKYLNKFINN